MPEKLAKKTKPLKLPKSLGACVDLYHDMREERLAEEKRVKTLKERETEVLNHIIDNLNKSDEHGAVGKRFKAIVQREDVPIVEDWESFYEHVRKTRGFDLLNRALNKAAVRERVEAGKKVPGVGSFTAIKLSVTKVK